MEMGRAGWIDLTVEDAPKLRDFYAAVVNWSAEEVPMGDYADYAMNPPGSDQAAAGVCHRRGQNADVPTGWMVYFTVPDLDAALKAAEARGGTILRHSEGMAFLKDPSGATFGLWESKEG